MNGGIESLYDSLHEFMSFMSISSILAVGDAILQMATDGFLSLPWLSFLSFGNLML